jgi:hypothetical protein
MSLWGGMMRGLDAAEREAWAEALAAAEKKGYTGYGQQGGALDSH